MSPAGRPGIVGLAAAALLLALAGCATVPPPSGPVIAVRSAPVPLDLADPAHRAIGKFRYAGGFALTSDEPRLHGLSDLVLTPGDGILSVTDDGGDLLTATLTLDADGAPAGLSDVRLTAQSGLDGAPLKDKAWTDAEGLTRLRNGDRLVSFEREHRVWRYPAAGGPPVAAPMPPTVMAENDGMEGLAAAPTVGADAYWVGVEPGDIWFCRLKSGCEAVTGLPVPPMGMRISSLATGPGGELVILHHVYIPGFGSRIQVSVIRDPRGAKTLIGRFELQTPLTIDNLEGIAVQKRPHGEWRLYLLSDDNFRASQRTLLLAFDWTPPKR